MNFKIKLILIALIVIGPVLAVMGYQSKAKYDRLMEKGKIAPGMIGGGDWKKSRKGVKSYHFDITYKPETGAPITKKFSVSSKYFESKVSSDAIVDPIAEVRYNPENPDESELVGEEKNSGLLVWVGPIVCLIGIFGTRAAFKSKPAA